MSIVNPDPLYCPLPARPKTMTFESGAIDQTDNGQPHGRSEGLNYASLNVFDAFEPRTRETESSFQLALHVPRQTTDRRSNSLARQAVFPDRMTPKVFRVNDTENADADLEQFSRDIAPRADVYMRAFENYRNRHNLQLAAPGRSFDSSLRNLEQAAPAVKGPPLETLRNQRETTYSQAFALMDGNHSDNARVSTSRMNGVINLWNRTLGDSAFLRLSPQEQSARIQAAKSDASIQGADVEHLRTAFFAALDANQNLNTRVTLHNAIVEQSNSFFAKLNRQRSFLNSAIQRHFNQADQTNPLVMERSRLDTLESAFDARLNALNMERRVIRPQIPI